jgi:DNA-binding IclR family transcriptional regulator
MQVTVVLMVRKAGFDERKVLAMVQVLLMSNPDGLWLRQVARETSLSPSTIARYLDTVLRPLVEDSPLGAQKPLLRVIRLKPFVIERLEVGGTLADVVRTVRIVSKFR